MRVRCVSGRIGLVPGDGVFRVGETEQESISLTVGRIYEVLDERYGFYQIVDDSGDAYDHPARAFEVVT